MENIIRLKNAINDADAVFIGAGAGLSTAAGFTYSGERFDKYFYDFKVKYSINDMYSGGFYPFSTIEEQWAWWSRHIWVNRYMNPPKPVYSKLFELVNANNYFVITTNVDHCFQNAGFDKSRLFYMQGDYGLWQCSTPCHDMTYDNEATVRNMLIEQGFVIGDDNDLTAPNGLKMRISTDSVPICPKCGEPMTMNLRSDDKFVQDEGWYQAKKHYDDFVQQYSGSKAVFLELGVGFNTPVWIKYPFWQMTARNPKATYACLNMGEAFAPKEIALQSICIDGNIAEIL